jgi:cell envelope opacity-associated protein A
MRFFASIVLLAASLAWAQAPAHNTLAKTAQVNYNLANYSLRGTAYPTAVAHIVKVWLQDNGTERVAVIVYASPAQLATYTPMLTVLSYTLTVTDGQTMAQVYQSLLADPVAGPVFAGSTPVVGE